MISKLGLIITTLFLPNLFIGQVEYASTPIIGLNISFAPYRHEVEILKRRGIKRIETHMKFNDEVGQLFIVNDSGYVVSQEAGYWKESKKKGRYFDPEISTIYKYNNDHRIVEIISKSTEEYERKNEKKYHRTSVIYDSLGNILSAERVTILGVSKDYFRIGFLSQSDDQRTYYKKTYSRKSKKIIEEDSTNFKVDINGNMIVEWNDRFTDSAKIDFTKEGYMVRKIWRYYKYKGPEVITEEIYQNDRLLKLSIAKPDSIGENKLTLDTSWKYDLTGKLSEVTQNPNGLIRYTYDEEDLLTTKVAMNTSGMGTYVEEYEYK